MDPQKLELYSILDRVSNLFGTPVPALSEKIVVRSIAQTLRTDPDCCYAMYPADYALFCIGSFDVVTGDLVPARREILSDFRGIAPKGGELSGGNPPEVADAAADAGCDHNGATSDFTHVNA